MYIKNENSKLAGLAKITSRCHNCGREVVYEGIQNQHDVQTTHHIAGFRFCPVPTCRALVFFVINSSTGRLESQFPEELIDFNKTQVPARLVATFNEALVCHAQKCFKASAIMVRRTLEELCDEKGATGKDLMSRIESMKDRVILPPQLFEAMHELRLLGNDAAHLEAKVYDSVGEDEVKVAVELTKEILKATYQMDDLLGKMKALKKPA